MVVPNLVHKPNKLSVTKFWKGGMYWKPHLSHPIRRIERSVSYGFLINMSMYSFDGLVENCVSQDFFFVPQLTSKILQPPLFRFYKSWKKNKCWEAGGWAVVPHRNERSEMTRSTTNSRNKCSTKFLQHTAPKKPPCPLGTPPSEGN